MIPFFDPAQLAAAYILADAPAATCISQPIPTVELSFVNKLPTQNHTVSETRLSQLPVDTKFAHGKSELFVTKGVTVANVTPKYTFGFKATKDPATGGVCLWIQSAKITVEYAPEIYIASEVWPDSCHYKEILKHELRHANTTVITLNKYLPQIQAAAQATIRDLGVEPLPDKNLLKSAKAHMEQNVAEAVHVVADEMYKDNLLFQQQIDTREEYLRMSHVCPGEP